MVLVSENCCDELGGCARWFGEPAASGGAKWGFGMWGDTAGRYRG